MGLAASQSRFLSLTARKGDLEYMGQQVNNKRTVLANLTQTLFTQYMTLTVPVQPIKGTSTDAEYDTELTKYNNDKAAYDAKIAEINLKSDGYQSQDKALELELKNIDTQHQTVQTEIDAVKKVIDKNIEMTFKTFA